MTPPMVDNCFTLRTFKFIDDGVLIHRISIEMSRGNFLKDAAGFDPETVPHAGHDEAGVAGVEGALLPVAGEMEDAVQHLEGFLF